MIPQSVARCPPGQQPVMLPGRDQLRTSSDSSAHCSLCWHNGFYEVFWEYLKECSEEADEEHHHVEDAECHEAGVQGDKLYVLI